jgi:3-isopropylmalate dehydrogenase
MTLPLTIGILEGEGVGPELIQIALRILSVLEQGLKYHFQLQYGGMIGKEAKTKTGKALTPEVTQFCQDLFAQKMPILSGPGGDRFVYDLRKEFDLFYKILPIKEIGISGRMKLEFTQNVDMLLLRENAAGVYQGTWSETLCPSHGRWAEHSFHYSEKEVTRFLNVAIQIASKRKGELTVVLKDTGIPSISELWKDCTKTIAENAGVKYSFMNIDYAAYYLLQHAQKLDLIATPNLFGDILGDLGAVLLGSRGLSCSGNFSANGAAVYQTNHGCAFDLVGTDRANPIGQIQSLAMLLQESFGLLKEAGWIEQAIKNTLNLGWRTDDLMASGCKLAKTNEMGDLIAEELRKLIC